MMVVRRDQGDYRPELYDYAEPELEGKPRKLAEVLPSQALTKEGHAEAVRGACKLRQPRALRDV